MKSRRRALLILVLQARCAAPVPVPDGEAATAGSWLLSHQQAARMMQEQMDELSLLQTGLEPRVTHRVFMDMSIGTQRGRLLVGLFGDVVPKTVENFVALSVGDHGKPGHLLHYKGSRLHRIITGFMAQGGDFTLGNGRGGESIWGGTFDDENFVLKHDQAGTLSMANYGKNTNTAQFFITFKPTPHLDGKHVVFGKLLEGFEVLRAIEAVGSRSGAPSANVTIVDCGLEAQSDEHEEPIADVLDVT